MDWLNKKFVGEIGSKFAKWLEFAFAKAKDYEFARLYSVFDFLEAIDVKSYEVLEVLEKFANGESGKSYEVVSQLVKELKKFEVIIREKNKFIVMNRNRNIANNLNIIKLLEKPSVIESVDLSQQKVSVIYVTKLGERELKDRENVISFEKDKHYVEQVRRNGNHSS